MANGNPYIKNRLNKIREENQDAFDSGNFDLLLEKYNEGASGKFSDVATLVRYYNYYDQQEQDDSEKKNPLLNDQPQNENLESISDSGEGDTSSDIFEENKDYLKEIRNFVYDIESKGNYDAYQGHYLKGMPQVDFQNQTIDSVLNWQKQNKNKAIGALQIKPQTLKRMMKKMNISGDEIFSPALQDKIFDELVKERGGEEFLKTGEYKDFALGMSKEWASIPLVNPHDGKLPGQSYYADQGTNKARSDVNAWVKLLQRNVNFSNKFTANYFQRANNEMINSIYSNITPDFLRGKSEEQLELDLKKQFLHLGFDVKQGGGVDRDDQVIISHPDIPQPFVVDIDRFEKGGVMGFFQDPNERFLKKTADDLKDYIKQVAINVNPGKRYQATFDRDNVEAFDMMKQEILLNPEQVSGAIKDIREKTELLQGIPETIKTGGLPTRMGEDAGQDYIPNPAYVNLKNEINLAKNVLSRQQNQKRRLTVMLDRLLDSKGGLEKVFQDTSFESFKLQQAILEGFQSEDLLFEYLRMPSIKIDGRNSSLNTLREMLLDEETREAIWRGDIDVYTSSVATGNAANPKITTEGQVGFEGTRLQKGAQYISEEAAKMMRRNSEGKGFQGAADYQMRKYFPWFFGNVLSVGSEIGTFLYDVLQMPFEGANYLNKAIGAENADKVDDYLRGKTAAHFDGPMKQLKEFARTNLLSQVPEESGTFLESESFTEAGGKGISGFLQSLPFIAAFMANPELGIAVVGSSTYGRTLQENAEYQSFAQEIANSGGDVPTDLERYLHMSKAYQRGVALSKGGAEALTTYLFTYRYFKNLAKLSKPGQDLKSFRDAVNINRGRFLPYLKEYGKSLKLELPEEMLISIENNFIDEMAGLREVSTDQYLDDAYNAGGHAAFSSAGMSVFGTRSRRRYGKDLVRSTVKRTIENRNFNRDKLILETIELQETPGFLNNPSLKKRHTENMKKIGEIENATKDLVDNAPESKLIRFAELDLEIAQVVFNAKKSSIDIKVDQTREATEISKDDKRNPQLKGNNTRRIIELDLKKLLGEQDAIIREIDPKTQFVASIDTKQYLDNFIGVVAPGSSDFKESEVVFHNSRNMDGTLSEGELKTNTQAKESGIETLSDTPNQEGGSDGVFFTSDPQITQMGDTNGQFIFDKSKIQQNLKPGRSTKENEQISDGPVPINRQNGLVGIKLFHGKDISDEIFSEPYIKGKKPNYTNDEQVQKAIDLDKENTVEYFKNKDRILKRAQEFADKFGVPVTITQHSGNYQVLSAAGHKSNIRDQVVYPKDFTSEDYGKVGIKFPNQVRIVPPETDQDQKYRNTAENLIRFRGLATMQLPLSDQSEHVKNNKFESSPETIQGLIDYFNTTLESDLNSKQKKLVNGIVEEINKARSYEDFRTLPLDRYAAETILMRNKMDEVQLSIPKEDIGKKRKPQSSLEKLFGDGLTQFADLRMVFSNLFKNSNVKKVFLTQNSIIDTGIAKGVQEGTREKEKIGSIEHITTKPKGGVKEFLSNKNIVERVFLAHLGKYAIRGLEGERLALDRQTQFLEKKQRLSEWIDEQAEDSSPKALKERQKNLRKIYDDFVGPAESYADLMSRAQKYNVESVEYVKNLYKAIGPQVLEVMRNFYGLEPAQFGNYLPTLTKNVKGEIGIETDMDLLNITNGFMNTPGNLKESTEQTGKIKGDLVFENYEQILIDRLTSAKMIVDNIKNIYVLKGMVESKQFEDLFDTEQESMALGKDQSTNDFGRNRDFILKVLRQKVAKMNQVTTNKKLPASLKTGFARIGQSLLKNSSALRLGSGTMRPKQYWSASMATFPLLKSRQARQFLTKRFALFNVGFGVRTAKNNANKQTLLSSSLTQIRTGLSKARGLDALNELKYEKPGTAPARYLQNVLDFMDKGGDFSIKYSLQQTDQLAAFDTFLAYYMDYEMQNNPDTKQMTDDEFFEYAAKNINKEAIAYADDMVGRSQTQSDSWNSTGMYGQDSKATGKILADMLFTFGRFQNNRKVGIANDLSIIYSDFATSDDKNVAQNRLLSAAIEIGVFKFLSPIIQMGIATSLTPYFAQLLGYDEELDVMIEKYEKMFGSSGADFAKTFKFQLDNYQRSLGKEFTTALIDGMTPLPLPSALAELGFAGLNRIAESNGIDPLFNVYSPEARGMFDNTIDGFTEDGVMNSIMEFGGLYQMALKDAVDVSNSLFYSGTDKFQPFMAGGKSRYVKGKADKASDILALSTILNYFIFHSADINTFNRKLRGVIERDYLKTKPSVSQEIEMIKKRQERKPKQNVKGNRPFGSAEKLLNQVKLNQAIQENLSR